MVLWWNRIIFSSVLGVLGFSNHLVVAMEQETEAREEEFLDARSSPANRDVGAQTDEDEFIVRFDDVAISEGQTVQVQGLSQEQGHIMEILKAWESREQSVKNKFLRSLIELIKTRNTHKVVLGYKLGSSIIWFNDCSRLASLNSFMFVDNQFASEVYFNMYAFGLHVAKEAIPEFIEWINDCWCKNERKQGESCQEHPDDCQVSLWVDLFGVLFERGYERAYSDAEKIIAQTSQSDNFVVKNAAHQLKKLLNDFKIEKK